MVLLWDVVSGQRRATISVSSPITNLALRTPSNVEACITFTISMTLLKIFLDSLVATYDDL